MTVRAAADVLLDSPGNSNTVRNHGIGVGKTTERIGGARPLASVADDEIDGTPEPLWGTAAVNTWNSRRAGALPWPGWCRERGYDGPVVPAWAKRLTVPDPEPPTRSKGAIDRLVARREVHLREKTLRRMLHETTARAEEVLGVSVQDPDFAGRRCPARSWRWSARRRNGRPPGSPGRPGLLPRSPVERGRNFCHRSETRRVTDAGVTVDRVSAPSAGSLHFGSEWWCVAAT